MPKRLFPTKTLTSRLLHNHSIRLPFADFEVRQSLIPHPSICTVDSCSSGVGTHQFFRQLPNFGACLAKLSKACKPQKLLETHVPAIPYSAPNEGGGPIGFKPYQPIPDLPRRVVGIDLSKPPIGGKLCCSTFSIRRCL